VLRALLRGFSYLFHLALALFLLAIAGLALASGGASLHLEMLPWTGATLTYVAMFSSLFGLAAIILALRRKWRAFFFLWSVAVAAMLLKGYIFGGYKFSPGEVPAALCLTGGALVAVVGAWWRSEPARGR
jgi:peptidoglycan/LPS O-acetylase OafA/YrhL